MYRLDDRWVMGISTGERHGSWGSGRAWQAGGGVAGAEQLKEPDQENVFALLMENCSHSVLMSSFLQGAAFVIEAVCEELEVLSLEMVEERDFFYLLPKTIRLQYCRGNCIMLLQVKRDLLRRVGRTVDRDVVIASSSLRLPLDKVATSDA